ncbi:NAD(P)-dependent oxidoreductase [Echinicola jeungdonensis]|uniref:Saccharopine dehydrogenase [NAD(+), L-lysine-forming] n=1 Tax=Echinicola jeungdonensis TaxID=709343 RepID=A0ABV5J8H7_9BACT|nr:NAD(P)-dependent oxidoreductase [Echinicola jeungdonensis]MDN3669427.1 NAD(P)-dependent oxidoreductase [Echinicola jeungdonensis]
MKIGLIKEGKFPVDRRVAFTPKQLAYMQEKYAGKITFVVEGSPVRAFSDDEYRENGIPVVPELADCDILMGIKEVPIPQLMDHKTYFFFSHTIKKQAYNRPLLRAIMEKGITLIDYEVLRNQGERVVAFGRWAGIVGGYNGLWTYGKKTGLFDLRRAKDCDDLEDLLQEAKKIQLPPIKMVITGDGRVGNGVREILLATGIKEVAPKELLNNYYDEPVFTQLGMGDYNRRKTDGGFDKEEFSREPELYESHFLKFTEVCDILFAAAYWDPKAPRLFEARDFAKEEFNLSVIADITCDIEGSIPTTIKASTIADPIYDVDRERMEELPPFGSQHSLSVMAIDNLPCELPRDASEDFGKQLMDHIIPALLEENSQLIEEATIVKKGQLTEKFAYLEDFVKEFK